MAEAASQSDPQQIVSCAAKALHRNLCAGGGGAVVFIVHQTESTEEDSVAPPLFAPAAPGGGVAAMAAGSSLRGPPARGEDKICSETSLKRVSSNSNSSDSAPRAAAARSGDSSRHYSPRASRGSSPTREAEGNSPRSLLHIETASERTRSALQAVYGRIVASESVSSVVGGEALSRPATTPQQGFFASAPMLEHSSSADGPECEEGNDA